ncbi:hypothetical protein G7046_g5563 [Stylonectria norvegica]|nr:hypothetical protein G7046_g5563 [Stylonectria norvegica]
MLLPLLGLCSGSPIRGTPEDKDAPLHIYKRQVPQEHSHDFVLTITREFLKLNNPKGISDVVFGLLGNGAAAAGAGDVTNLDCLKQETADQAYTNAKAAVTCEEWQGLFYSKQSSGIQVVLDPASKNAGDLNKAITLELAKQLAGIGADPSLALLSGTFAPGDPSDVTGAGNSCDDEEPNLGCIFSKGLLVLDATEDEVSSAVADVAQTFTGTGGIFASDLVDFASFAVASATGNVDLKTAENAGASTAVALTTTIGSTDAQPAESQIASSVATSAAGCVVANPTVATTASRALQNASTLATSVAKGATNTILTVLTTLTSQDIQATGSPGSKNIQSFTGTLAGPPPPVESSAGNRPFSVNGNTFTDSGAALSRSCDIQHNACANAANSGALAGGVAQCEKQVGECKAANSLRRRYQNDGSGT